LISSSASFESHSKAPKSGYRFGKGIYFADICDKSIGYCRGAGSDYILMMLVEVTLGRQKVHFFIVFRVFGSVLELNSFLILFFHSSRYLCSVHVLTLEELKQDQYMEKALPGSDSTKAMGAIAPESSFTLPDGVIVYVLHCRSLTYLLFCDLKFRVHLPFSTRPIYFD
jgi:hypothetical protein